MTKTTKKNTNTKPATKPATKKSGGKLAAFSKQKTETAAVIEDSPLKSNAGAPRQNREKKVTAYMDLSTWTAIKMQSFNEGRTGNDIILDAINMYLQRVGGPEKRQ
jgi:hypothetical protein